VKQFDTTILSFGLSQSQQHVIEQTISPIFQHIDCNNRIDDLFQIAAVCLIINADAMTSGQRKCLDIDMSTLFWTYLNRTIYLMVYEFIGNNKIAFLALSRVK
jgi:hypothetical protein